MVFKKIYLNPYPVIIKRSLLFLFLCFGISTGFAQSVKYRNVNNGDLVYILNNIERSIKFQNSTGDLFVNVYIVSDPSGSAHIEGTDEITNSIYIATSEDGEAPDQYLYRLTSVYDPKIISYTKSVKHPQLILSYGPADKRKKIVISIELKGLEIKQI
jgi:hypothetical protein